MSIEKLVEECDALILNCSGDTRMMARAVIRRTLEYAAGEADKHRALVPDHDPDKPVPDAVGQGYGNAALNLAAAYRFAARSLPKAEGEDDSTPPKGE